MYYIELRNKDNIFHQLHVNREGRKYILEDRDMVGIVDRVEPDINQNSNQQKEQDDNIEESWWTYESKT